jgi:P-type conjugative transfer protein TrbL
MNNLNLDTLTTQFYNAGVHYSTAIQPYALKLFFALFLIDIIVTWIQYSAEGQLDPSFFFSRMIKHVLSGGFVYLMIINGFSWMYLVIQSFSRIGTAISGLPSLSPQSVLQTGLNMTSTLINSPTTSGAISSLELALVEGFCALAVGAAFLIVAIELLLTLVKAYLTTGLGVILLGFGGNRFTASASEGYFTNVIRIGVKILFFYAVLAIAMHMVAQWQADLAAACKPIVTAVPLITSYFVPPTKVMTTVCSGTIPLTNMLYYAALAAVFAVVTVAVPSMAAELVGGTVGLALGHAFEAAYTAQTIARIVNPITSAIKGTAAGVAGFARGSGSSFTGGGDAMSAAQSVVNQQQKQSAAETASDTSTKPLNPFDGQPPGYNYIGGPQLPPPTNGPGSGGAALEFQLGRPGQHTKNIAVDITELQNGKGKDVS